YLDHGDPRRALELLERGGSASVGLWSQAAQQLAARGDDSGQRDALLAAIAAAPKNLSLLSTLSRLDPELAIRTISSQLAAAPPGPERAPRDARDRADRRRTCGRGGRDRRRPAGVGARRPARHHAARAPRSRARPRVRRAADRRGPRALRDVRRADVAAGELG